MAAELLPDKLWELIEPCPWLLVIVAVLLGVGFIQLYVRRDQCQNEAR